MGIRRRFRFASLWAGLLQLAAQGFSGSLRVTPRVAEDFRVDLEEVIGNEEPDKQKQPPVERLTSFYDRLEEWSHLADAPLTMRFRRGYVWRIEIGRRS